MDVKPIRIFGEDYSIRFEMKEMPERYRVVIDEGEKEIIIYHSAWVSLDEELFFTVKYALQQHLEIYLQNFIPLIENRLSSFAPYKIYYSIVPFPSPKATETDKETKRVFINLSIIAPPESVIRNAVCQAYAKILFLPRTPAYKKFVDAFLCSYPMDEYRLDPFWYTEYLEGNILQKIKENLIYGMKREMQRKIYLYKELKRRGLIDPKEEWIELKWRVLKEWESKKKEE